MVDEFILAAVKETSKEYKDLPNYDKLCEEHAEKVETFLKMVYKGNLLDKLQTIKEKHGAVFPQISDKLVFFTLPNKKTRIMYVYSKGSWGRILGEETPESKAFMDDLLSEGIITEFGIANCEYPIKREE